MITLYSPEDIDRSIFGQPLTDTLQADQYHARSLYAHFWKWETRIRAAGIDPARVDAAIPQGVYNGKNNDRHAGWYYEDGSTFGRALTWQEVDDRILAQYHAARRPQPRDEATNGS